MFSTQTTFGRLTGAEKKQQKRTASENACLKWNARELFQSWALYS